MEINHAKQNKTFSISTNNQISNQDEVAEACLHQAHHRRGSSVETTVCSEL